MSDHERMIVRLDKEQRAAVTKAVEDLCCVVQDAASGTAKALEILNRIAAKGSSHGFYLESLQNTLKGCQWFTMAPSGWGHGAGRLSQQQSSVLVLAIHKVFQAIPDSEIPIAERIQEAHLYKDAIEVDLLLETLEERNPGSITPKDLDNACQLKLMYIHEHLEMIATSLIFRSV